MANFVEEQKLAALNQHQSKALYMASVGNNRFPPIQHSQTPSNFINQEPRYTSSTGYVKPLYEPQSEKREGITDFKNKNLQNNMRGLKAG
jgi:hypothetical protein